MHGIVIFFALSVLAVIISASAALVRVLVAYSRDVRYWKKVRRNHRIACRYYHRRYRFNNVFM